ncbi:MAG: hypothetical protein WAU88_09270 [Candidatus Zixiibacteriota bacterium]
MKTLIAALTLVVLFCSMGFGKDSATPYVAIDTVYPYQSRIALTIGTPAAIQLNYSHWGPGSLGYRLTAGGLDGAAGVQVEITERISRKKSRTMMDISFGVGYSNIYVDHETNEWTYAGGFWTLNSGALFLQSGVTVGDGDYDSPQIFLQIGFSLFSTHRR